LRRRSDRERERSVTATRIIITGILITIILPLSLIYALYLMRTTHAGTDPNGQSASIARLTQNHATGQAQGSATAISLQQVALGPLILSSDLAQNSNSLWAEDATSCKFSSGSYHVIVTQANFLQPCPLALPQDNAVVQVDATLHAGYNIGILVRLKGDQFYDFEINNQRQFFF